MNKVKFAILGPGGVARLHVRAFKEIENAEISLVYSHREESAKKFGEEFGIPYTTNYQDVIDSDVDAIDVCTPHNIRSQLIRPAILSGKHILCEKPLSISIDEGREIIELARKYNRKLGVIFQSRFSPDIVKVKEFLDKGGLGRLILITSYVKWYRPKTYYTRWHGKWETEGGGVLINQAIHDLDLMIFLGGNISQVSAFTNHLFHDIEVEDTAVGIMRYEKGHLGNIIATTSIYKGYPKSLEIHGENGSIFLKEGKLSQADLRDGFKFDHRALGDNVKSGSSDPLNIDINGHKDNISDFVNAIIKDREPKITGEEALKSVALVNALYKASSTNSVVEVDMY